MALLSGMWTLSQVSQALQNGQWLGAPPTVEYLIVAGGGGGGANRGGGGGAGGVLAGLTSITQNTQCWVTIGSGGAGQSYANFTVAPASNGTQ